MKSVKNRTKTTWEWRAFWPAGSVVEVPMTLGNINCGANLPEEENTDVYLFVHGKRDNIKFRGRGLKVKPVVEAFDEFCAFAPSEKVTFPEQAEALSDIFPRLNEVHAKLRSREEMLSALSATGYRPGVIEVAKTRREYSAIFGVHIEFARLSVNRSTFYSISLESRYLTALRILSRNIPIGSGIVGGYSQFLELAASQKDHRRK